MMRHFKEKDKTSDLQNSTEELESAVENEYVIIGEKKYFVINGYLDLSDKKISNISEFESPARSEKDSGAICQ